MNLGLKIKERLDEQGRTIAWLADKLSVNEKTLAGKLNRNSITGEDLLLMSYLLNINLIKLQETFCQEKLNKGGSYMNPEKFAELVNKFTAEGTEFTDKQKNYLDSWYGVEGDIKYLKNTNTKEIYLWSSYETYQSLANSEFHLIEQEADIFIKFEDQVIIGFKNYELAERFVNAIIQVQDNDEIGNDGEYIEEEE